MEKYLSSTCHPSSSIVPWLVLAYWLRPCSDLFKGPTLNCGGMEMSKPRETWFWTVKFDGMFSSGEIWSPEISEFVAWSAKCGWRCGWCKSLCLPPTVPSNPDKAKLLGTRTKLHAQVLLSFSSSFQRKSSKWSVGYSLTHVRVDEFILD